MLKVPLRNLGEVIVEMRGITKKFPGVIANDGINFDLRRGEIHALLGENGAGKTTLMNILYGLYKPDSGKIYVYGKRVNIKSPRDAMRLGIGMVHQFFKLVERYTVIENLALVTQSSFLFPARRLKAKIQRILRTYRWDINPETKIEGLSASERQKVEILKCIVQGAKILILDEPCSVLTPKEKEEFFEWLLSVKRNGYSIIFITHKLGEVMKISDRVTVLRKGRKVKTLWIKEVDEEILARLMIGRDISFRIRKEPTKKGKAVLEVKSLQVAGDDGTIAIDDVSFTVREGEILGIAGVGGSGQRELVEAIAGLRKIKKGRIIVSGFDLTRSSQCKFVRRISYIPAERSETLAFSMSLEENLILKDYWRSKFSGRIFLNPRSINDHAKKIIAQYKIVAPSAKVRVASLSGGNIQRVILARELTRDFDLLIAVCPTAGLDVGLTKHVRQLLLEQRRKGKAILLLSEDLDELIELSDRIAILFEGRIIGIVDPSVGSEKIGMLMLGIKS